MHIRILSLAVCVFLLSFPAHAEEVTNELPTPKTPKNLYSDEDFKAEPKKIVRKSDPKKPWFRSTGEFLAYRTQRQGLATDPSTKISTDGKRFDMTVGNRIPLITWGEDEPGYGWSAGLDGGMLASLTRYQNNGKLTFATETFDGFFGAYLGRAAGQWLLMLRTAHLSAHLVDNSPDVFTNTRVYNLFWNEFISGFFVKDPTEEESWNLYMQGGVGHNNVAEPRSSNPRLSLGATYSHHLNGPDSVAVIFSADALRAGVAGQKMHYAYFFGLGRAGAYQSTKRPFRAGVTLFRGSDHRNQYFDRTNHFTAFTIHTDF